MKSLFFLFLCLLNSFVDAQNDNVYLLGEWTKLGLPSCSSDGENVFNEVWGVEVNGLRFAAVGSTMGTHFIEIGADPRIEIPQQLKINLNKKLLLSNL